jgi:hypothetical protein
VKSLLPKTTLGKVGFWVGIGGALSIWAIARGDRSRLQMFVLLPIIVLALIWSVAELAFPH